MISETQNTDNKVQVKDILEYQWKTYNVINEWIRFSDAKAGAILAANGAIVTIAIDSASQINALLSESFIFWIFFLIGVSSLFLSTFFSLRCLTPKLKVGSSESIIFFGHIANSSLRDYRINVKEVFGKEVELNHLCDQIWANSKVAWGKYEFVALTIKCFSITVFTLFLTISLAILLNKFA